MSPARANALGREAIALRLRTDAAEARREAAGAVDDAMTRHARVVAGG